MKKLLPLFLVLLISQIVYSQTKFDEYEQLDSDSESTRIDYFLNALNEQPESRGLIVVYSGDNLERIGNITAYIEGVKFYIDLRGVKSDRVSFLIGEGKTKLSKEFWILPDETKKPQIRSNEADLSNLKDKILYASTCIGCEPVVHALRNDGVNLEDYLKILKDNPGYQALIIIHRSGSDTTSKSYVKEIKQLIKQKSINGKRIRFELVKMKDDAATAQFYIIPEKKS